MKINNFDYFLPKSLIAQKIASLRDHSRLLVVKRRANQIEHSYFFNLPKFLQKGDVLVFNQTKVFPARLFGKKSTGGKVEVLLLKKVASDIWEAISKPGLKVGQLLIFAHQLKAQVVAEDSGIIQLKFNFTSSYLLKTINEIGQTPLPPYIKSSLPEKTLREKYQTIYAQNLGSAAAPTAGLHFTQKLLSQLQRMGIQLEFITLHVGLGTFKPVTEENLKLGKLHPEEYFLDDKTVKRLNQAKQEQRRVIAVGTTTTRVLESCSYFDCKTQTWKLKSGGGKTEIFIYPPFQFKFIDSLITNFHLPKSSLLMLIAAFCSYPNTCKKFTTFRNSIPGKAYEEAIKEKYRFYSFGDAMFII